jgi:GTPase Era involved in 16S rRNA processing
MINPARHAIKVLESALSKATVLTADEKNQLMRRLAQLHRREDDPRTFIAFIGEKKAGKTALVRALTGVPLPVAVRECTAAVCEIQVGIDWHHHATLPSGELKSFDPLDDKEQRKRLMKAQKMDILSVDKSIASRQEAQKQIDTAKHEEQEANTRREEAESALEAAKTALTEAIGPTPWVLSLFSWLSWLFGGIRRRIESIAKAEAGIIEAEAMLSERSQELEEHAEKTRLAEEHQSRILEETKGLTTSSRGQLEDARSALDALEKENEQKFRTELQSLIDVAQEPADRVTIHTPNANIPFNIVLLDTPGFNTEIKEHRQRAWEAIEEMADICILVSDLRQPMPDTALQMLERLEPFCPDLHVALTKTDLALAEAEELGGDPEEEVQEAEEIARQRILRRWERPMNIWTVASIEEEDQVRTRALFEDFWKKLPKEARNNKSRMLGAHSIREMMEILTLHMQSMEERIRQFDDVVEDVAYSMVAQLEEKEEEREQLLIAVKRHVKLGIRSQVGKLQENWVDQIQRCETKRSVRKTWDRLKKEMPGAYQDCAKGATSDLEQSISRAAGKLWKGEGSLEVDEVPLINPTDTPEEEDEQANGWGWTAGGAAAGAAMGLALSGGTVLPLLLAAGAGGLANMFLAPLAQAKENLQSRVEKGLVQEESNLCSQLDKLTEEIGDRILKAAERALKKQIEEREQQARRKKKEELAEVQTLWNDLYEARQKML